MKEAEAKHMKHAKLIHDIMKKKPLYGLGHIKDTKILEKLK